MAHRAMSPATPLGCRLSAEPVSACMCDHFLPQNGAHLPKFVSLYPAAAESPRIASFARSPSGVRFGAKGSPSPTIVCRSRVYFPQFFFFSPRGDVLLYERTAAPLPLCDALLAVAQTGRSGESLTQLTLSLAFDASKFTDLVAQSDRTKKRPSGNEPPHLFSCTIVFCLPHRSY